MNEIWILGATGRVGKGVAADLAAKGFALGLVGRDRARLEGVAKDLAGLGGQARVVVATSLEATALEVAKAKPAVVVNTVGPFVKTALPIARACLPNSHYVDVSNELNSFLDVFKLEEQAKAAGRCFVTGAGFGVLGTEGLVVALCKGRPAAAKVRVDGIPMVDGSGGGVVGEALAGSILDNLADGGRRYEGGRLVPHGFGAEAEELTLPDGTKAVTASAPTGDLEAARRASGAPDVVGASSMAPASTLARGAVAVAGAILSIDVLLQAAKRRLAKVEMKPGKAPARKHSFTHARVEWSDGTVREGWLKTGDGSSFTNRVMAEVAARLARGEGKPGTFTPGVLFGAELAELCGAEITTGG